MNLTLEGIKVNNIIITRVKEKYIESYWKTFEIVASERKYLGTVNGFSLDETKKFIQDSIKNSQPHFFVVDENDEVVGWCDIMPIDSEALQLIGYLGIGLLKEYRGKGIGQQLLESTIQVAIQKGFKKVELEVRASNARAIHLYKKLGFLEEKRVENGLCIDGVNEDVIQMAKAL